jgi:thiamine biosynthesis protein ThiS
MWDKMGAKILRETRVKIMLNGDPFELPGPSTVSRLLAQLDIDARRVAVEHNLVVLKRTAFDTTEVQDGDQVEIVNFVGGGSWTVS